jgi:hypothetical protein
LDVDVIAHAPIVHPEVPALTMAIRRVVDRLAIQFMLLPMLDLAFSAAVTRESTAAALEHLV